MEAKGMKWWSRVIMNRILKQPLMIVIYVLCLIAVSETAYATPYIEVDWGGGNETTLWISVINTSTDGEDFVGAVFDNAGSNQGVTNAYADFGGNFYGTETIYQDSTEFALGYLPDGSNDMFYLDIPEFTGTGPISFSMYTVDGAYSNVITIDIDTTPPTPDPMKWATPPYGKGPSTVRMFAITAIDDSGVEYYFEETSGNSGGSDSGWQDSPVYEDTGLERYTTYSYRVKARDRDPYQNETAYSTVLSAETESNSYIPYIHVDMTSTFVGDALKVDIGTTNISLDGNGLASSNLTAGTDHGVIDAYADYFSGFEPTINATNTSFYGGYDNVGEGTIFTYTFDLDSVPTGASNYFVFTMDSDLGATTGNQYYFYILDDGSIQYGEGVPPDITPPSPDPMTWATSPYATGPSTISMVAITASDDNGVEYYFEETSGNTGGTDSGWQDSPVYEDTGLDPETTYSYRVMVRDKSVNQNETGYSDTLSAITESIPDTTPPNPDPMTWSTSPYALSTSAIRMVATTATDDNDVEYYFEETSGNTGGTDSGWQDSPVYEDTGLDPEKTYSYRVMTRDKSPNQNETAYSSTMSAMTESLPDTTPPNPDPMTWSTPPYSVGPSAISMEATTATDDSDVEYYFEETTGNTGGNDSGWQDSPVYEDTGLQPETTYSYRVKARDKSPNQNETGYSGTMFAVTEALPDTSPPSPDPMTWTTSPYALSSSAIRMEATTATDDNDVEYYFDETSGNTGGSDSGWQDSAIYEDTGLQPETTYRYRVRARDKSTNQNATAYSSTLSATTESIPDTTPPTPDPMTWGTSPYAVGSSTIRMEATTATDDGGVEYYFEETSGNSGGNDSGWQDSPIYEDTGLNPDTTYSYRVMARDKSPNQNETGYSSTLSATTVSIPDTTSPDPDPMTWVNPPYAFGSSLIRMEATTATDDGGVEYYFEETTGNTGGSDSGWQDSTIYEDAGIQTDTTYSYRVKARDKSPNQNETGYSDTFSVLIDGGGGGDIPTPTEDNIETIQAYGSDENITLESSSGTTLSNCQALDNPSPEDTPSSVDFPYGLFSFTIDGVTSGGSTTITITLPSGASPVSYYKYGPTPTDSSDHWYEFMYDGETGAVISGNIITLHFVDGKRGDSDLTANGTIVDPGGPSIDTVVITPTSGDSGGGGGCFIGSLP
jgi:hypothetical protein